MFISAGGVFDSGDIPNAANYRVQPHWTDGAYELRRRSRSRLSVAVVQAACSLCCFEASRHEDRHAISLSPLSAVCSYT